MKNRNELICVLALLMLVVSPIAAQKRNSNTTIAIVRGDAISSDEIQRREALLTRDRPAQEGSAALRKLALAHAIRERILLQGAVSEGVSITDSEVIEFVSEMQRNARDAGAIDAITAFRTAATALGLTEDEFAHNPGVIEAYRKLMVLGRMRKLLRDRLPAEDRDKPEAGEIAVDRFVAGHSDGVVILDTQ
jgi:hypothetical protein